MLYPLQLQNALKHKPILSTWGSKIMQKLSCMYRTPAILPMSTDKRAAHKFVQDYVASLRTANKRADLSEIWRDSHIIFCQASQE